jgi:hypothetical protein
MKRIRINISTATQGWCPSKRIGENESSIEEKSDITPAQASKLPTRVMKYLKHPEIRYAVCSAV